MRLWLCANGCMPPMIFEALWCTVVSPYWQLQSGGSV